MATAAAGEPTPEFVRPAKRRKHFRKKIDAEADEDETPTGTLTAVAPVAEPEAMTVDELISHGAEVSSSVHASPEDTQLSTQDLIRLRKAAQRRKGGIEFSNHPTPSPAPETARQVVANDDVEDEVPEDIKRVISRFAPQTGQVTDDNDKHMYVCPSIPVLPHILTDTATNVARLAYIDSEIAKMHRQKDHSSNDNTTMTVSGQRNVNLQNGRQPAAIGRLHEVDLGPDARARNVALTEAAQRRLEGEPEEDEKPRLRRDGKPFRRKRRTSTDVKRDKLVEEVMRESRLEIYDDDDAAAEGDAGDGEADDRIAEQFRRDFLDAVSNRRRRAPASASAKAKGKAVASEPRGPKLGGSRSARAKIREKELEEAAKGKRR